MEPAKKAMAQFNDAAETIYRLEDVSQVAQAWQNIDKRHKATMKKILSEKQYKKYVEIFDLTIKNMAEEVMNEATAAK